MGQSSPVQPADLSARAELVATPADASADGVALVHHRLSAAEWCVMTLIALAVMLAVAMVGTAA